MTKVTPNFTKGKEPKYPYLGIDRDNTLIVWFTEPKTGIALWSGENSLSEQGQYSETWYEEYFETYEGSITLENKDQ